MSLPLLLIPGSVGLAGLQLLKSVLMNILLGINLGSHDIPKKFEQ